MSGHDETYGNPTGYVGPGARPRRPYTPLPRHRPGVFCRACQESDSDHNQRHCAFCGKELTAKDRY